MYLPPWSHQPEYHQKVGLEYTTSLKYLSLVSIVHLFILHGTDHLSCWVSFSLNNVARGVLRYTAAVEHSLHFSTGSCVSLSYAVCIQCCIPFREKTHRGAQGKTYCSLNFLQGHTSLNTSCSSTWHGTGNHQHPIAAMLDTCIWQQTNF